MKSCLFTQSRERKNIQIPPGWNSDFIIATYRNVGERLYLGGKCWMTAVSPKGQPTIGEGSENVEHIVQVTSCSKMWICCFQITPKVLRIFPIFSVKSLFPQGNSTGLVDFWTLNCLKVYSSIWEYASSVSEGYICFILHRLYTSRCVCVLNVSDQFQFHGFSETVQLFIFLF